MWSSLSKICLDLRRKMSFYPKWRFVEKSHRNQPGSTGFASNLRYPASDIGVAESASNFVRGASDSVEFAALAVALAVELAVERPEASAPAWQEVASDFEKSDFEKSLTSLAGFSSNPARIQPHWT